MLDYDLRFDDDGKVLCTGSARGEQRNCARVAGRRERTVSSERTTLSASLTPSLSEKKCVDSWMLPTLSASRSWKTGKGVHGQPRGVSGPWFRQRAPIASFRSLVVSQPSVPA